MGEPLSEEDRPPIWFDALRHRQSRLYKFRYVLLAAACLLIAAYLTGGVGAGFAILGGVVILASALIAPERIPVTNTPHLRESTGTVYPDRSVCSLADALRTPAFIVDLHGVVRHANAAGFQTFPSVIADDPLALTLRSPPLTDALESVAASGRGASIEYLDRGDTDRVFTVGIEPFRDNLGSRFLLLDFEDVTDRLAIARMRADFVANASHELRTPLASLTGFIETLQGPAKNDSEATSKFLSIMLDQAERMRRLIDDLLSLSRAEMRVHQPPTDSVDIVDVVHHVADALSPLAGELGVDMSITTELEGQVSVQGDRDELIQVFENLIENGLKYGAPGGVLQVEVNLKIANGEPRLWVHIRDEGPGISPEDLPRLTERFYRVDAATSREMKGTGLGLAIVKHILTRHKARLQIESVPDGGACFTVDLPYADKSKE